MSGARQRAARAGVSQGPARPTRDDHRPAVHTTGLRTPASSTRPAQRHGPDGPPSCVRQIGTTHKDGGTVRPPEGKDDGRQEEHRMRRLRQDPMRGLPARMRRLPCHPMRRLPIRVRGLRRRHLRRLHPPLRRLRRTHMRRLLRRLRELRRIPMPRLPPMGRLWGLLLRVLPARRRQGAVLSRLPRMAHHARTSGHVHRRTRNRGQRRTRHGQDEGQRPHRRLVHRPEPRRGTRIPDPHPHRRGLRRPRRPHRRHPHPFQRTRPRRRAHARTPHEPADPGPLVLGAQGTVRPSGTRPQHETRHRLPLVPSRPRRLHGQIHGGERQPRRHHRTAHLRTMGRDHRPQAPPRPRMGAPHVALLPRARTLPLTTADIMRESAHSAYRTPETTPAMRLAARKED